MWPLKETKEHFKTKVVFKDNQIKELLAKRFKKGKTSQFTYCLIRPLDKVHNIIMYIWSSPTHYNYFVAITLQAIFMDNDMWWNS